jgi:hypothetical protein
MFSPNVNLRLLGVGKGRLTATRLAEQTFRTM